MSLSNKHIPAYQIYDRMFLMRHQAQQGRHKNCKDPYQSWYHKHLEDVAEQFDITLEANDMTWITSVKKKVQQQWYTTWLKAMQQNDSTWSSIYIIFKQQPVMESYMKALVHPVTIALHKLRSSHFPFQHHIGRINHTHTRCKLCNAAVDEDIVHFLLHCTAYKHSSSLHTQIKHVMKHFSVQFQQEVDNYFTSDLSDNQQCAHLLSRTLPTAVNPHQHTLWQAMWYTIFHTLDKHLHIVVTRREALLQAHTRNQLQQVIKHNNQ